MAWSAPKGRPKVFQTRLKTFVKTLRRSDTRKSGDTSEKSSTIQSREARDVTDYFQPTQSQPELVTTASQEQPQEREQVSRRASTDASLREPHHWEAEEEGLENSWAISGPVAPQNDDDREPGLSVRVSLRFEHPLEFTYSRNYDSSPTLRVTENLCQGLIRRIDHSCYELITRKDPNASAATKDRGRTKPKRFELTTQISQGGELWATRTYTSYQKNPVTAEAAKEVILSSNRMVGLFLKRHDPDFIWRTGPLHDDLSPLPDAQRSPYRIGSIQSLNCVPRSEFIEKTQTFEATPGYQLDLSLTFLNRQGEDPRWQKDIQVSSNQTTPLTLAVAETLFSDASYALEGAVRSRRRHVQDQHAQCRSDGGTCQHYLEEASEIALKITNNFGPDFDHLARSIQSKLVLFEDGEAQDCTEFVDKLLKSIADARDTADVAIIETNDLDLKIVELRGSDWTLDEPLVFTLPSSTSYSRRSIEAILDRVQTGISDVLRGNAATVRYIAWKRGHLILDKTLVAREPKSQTRRWDTPFVSRSIVVNKLRRRVEQDIEMICKDTCSLPDDPSSEPDESEQPPAETSSSTGQPAGDDEEVSLPKSRPTGPRLARAAESVSGADEESSVGSYKPSSDEKRPSSPGHSVTSMDSKSSKIYRDLKTGARAFPLVPSTSTYGVEELLEQPDSHTEYQESSPPGTIYPTVLPIDDVLQDLNNHPTSTADSDSKSQRPEKSDAASEPARSTVSSQHSASAEKQRQRGSGYQASTVPSTPSLVSGNGQSPRSSFILTTPQMPGSMTSAELHLMMARRDSEAYAEDVEIPSESIEAETQQKSAGSTPEELPTAKIAKPKQRPSPLQRDLFMLGSSDSGDASSESDIQTSTTVRPAEEGHDSASSDGTHDDEASDHGFPKEVPQSSNGAPSGSIENRLSNATLVPSSDNVPEVSSSREITSETLVDASKSQAGTSKYGLNPPKTPSDAGFNFNDSNFAQTREEIDFSSFSSPSFSTSTAPSDYTAIRPPQMRYTNINGELHDVFDDDNEHAIADDNQSNGMTMSVPSTPTLANGGFAQPSNPSSPRTRGSFGSAGLLGLADSQNLIGVGLRRAIAMNSPPRRKASFPSSPLALRTIDFFATQPRRGSHGARELQILKRPSLRGDLSQRPASSGREFESRFRLEGTSASQHDGDAENKPTADLDAAVMKRSLSSNVLDGLHVREVVRKEKKKSALASEGGDEDGDENQRPGAGRPRSSSLMFLLAGATLASQMMRPG
ncbi:uncharacterized protein PG998_002208 [Apiospora kogelbergensis]|uniref:uncharacterized protein n=1 Tax=Apiospora kogelbergensis TaxID=1337665 RepID=UPI003130C231